MTKKKEDQFKKLFIENKDRATRTLLTCSGRVKKPTAQVITVVALMVGDKYIR